MAVVPDDDGEIGRLVLAMVARQPKRGVIALESDGSILMMLGYTANQFAESTWNSLYF